MTLPPPSDIACLLPASLALYRARRRGSLATAALCTAAALYCGTRWRLAGGGAPRLDVALCAAWPGVVAGAIGWASARRMEDGGPGGEPSSPPLRGRQPREVLLPASAVEPASGGGAVYTGSRSRLRYRNSGGPLAPVLRHGHPRADAYLEAEYPTLRPLAQAFPFVAYALLLSRYGSHLAPWWPAPLKAPRLALALVALLAAPAARRTLAGRVALLLAAGMAAGVVVDTWAAWESAQAALSAGVWVCAAGMVWRERA